MFPSTVVGKIISTNVIERLKINLKKNFDKKKNNESTRFSIFHICSNNNTNIYL